MRQPRCVIFVFAIAAAIIGTTAATEAGDNFWSPAQGVHSVNEFAVCGTTVYAATETGLFRSDGDPETWTRLRGNWTTQVACDGSKVIWQEIIGLVNTVFVSHDALQSVAQVNGLAGAASSGIQDLAIGGDLALATTYWSVFRSTDGGFNFPAAFPVLSESSGGYQLSAVWTNGTACAAAGSGGFAGNGIWHSPSGDIYTWVKVLDIGGMSWLDGSGHSTIISGDKYSGAVPNGYISTDAGLTWTQLPLSWGGTTGSYQRPFISETRILSRYSYEIFDPDSGLFIPYVNGPFLYDTDTGIGNDLDPSFPSDAEFRNQAIVETTDPIMLIAEHHGPVYWFRVPGGWPVAGFDFTPPFSPALDATPRVAYGPSTPAISLHPSAGDASWMYIYEFFDYLHVTYSAGSFNSSLYKLYGPSTDGWEPYSTSRSWDLYPSTGTHSFYAWYTDQAGNMTDPGVMSGTTTFPSSLNLGADGAWGTWMYARTGETFTIGTSGFTGDMDVYHWEPPGFGYPDNWANTYSNDSLTFTAAGTGYHLVILHNYPGAGTFDGTLTAQQGAGKAAPISHVLSKALPNSSVTPHDEGSTPYTESPAAHFIFKDGFETGDLLNWE